MSGGMGPGCGAALGWRWTLTIVVVPTVIIWAPVLWGISDNMAVARQVEIARAHAQFQVGQVVRSRVANFRGVITARDCYYRCEYLVRFVVGSMQPVWVEETEIVDAP